jgi:hypothetical protein
MELLDRYLEAVKKHLPWQRQDDIIAELRANLESQLEEKEAELGRPLTAAEAEAWLKQLGSPLQVAAGYKPQQYLIGPTIFPTYSYVLQLACTWAMIIYAIVSAVQIFARDNPSGSAVLEALLRAPFVLFTTAAWVTLVFAAIEFAITHYCVSIPALAAPSAGWSPAGLPPLEQQAAGKKPRSFAQAVAEAVFGFLLLIWVLLIPRYPWLLMGPGAVILDVSPYQLAPVWWQFFWCIVALNILQLGWNVADLWSGRWQQPQPIKHIVYKAVGLIPLLFLFSARDHALVLLKHPALDQARYGTTLHSINHWVNRGFLIVAVIASLQLVWDLGRTSVDAYRKREAAKQ